MNKILIATDGSPAAADAVEYAVELAAEQHGELTFVHVVPPKNPKWSLDAAALEEAKQLAVDSGVHAKVEVLVGDPVGAIVELADSIEPDLIVVGSRGRSAVAAALLGSVSLGVLRSARRPVLVVRGVRTHEAPKAPVPD